MPARLATSGWRCGGVRAFVAALDAAEGRLWIKDVIEDDPIGWRYRTLGRWIERGARLLGLSQAVDERAAEQIGTELGLLGMDHHILRERFGQSSRLQARGQVLREALSKLPQDRLMWSRILAAGQIAGLWRAPLQWVPELGQCVSPTSRLLRVWRGPP